MTDRIECPTCSHTFDAADSSTAKCPKCGQSTKPVKMQLAGSDAIKVECPTCGTPNYISRSNEGSLICQDCLELIPFELPAELTKPSASSSPEAETKEKRASSESPGRSPQPSEPAPNDSDAALSLDEEPAVAEQTPQAERMPEAGAPEAGVDEKVASDHDVPVDRPGDDRSVDDQATGDSGELRLEPLGDPLEDDSEEIAVGHLAPAPNIEKTATTSSSSVGPTDQLSAVPPPAHKPSDNSDVAALSDSGLGLAASDSDEALLDDEIPVGTLATAPAPKKEREIPESFGVSCQICGTRIHSTRNKIGSTEQCPDCYSDIEIRYHPSATQRQRPQLQVGSIQVAKPETIDYKEGTNPAIKKIAQDHLRQAAEEDAEVHERETRDDRSREKLTWFGHMWVFLADAALWGKMVVVAIILTLQIFGTRLAMDSGNPIIVLFVVVVSMVLVALFVLLISPVWTTIIRDTSTGAAKIHEWPSGGPFDWMGEAFIIGIPLLMSALPSISIFVAFWGSTFGTLTGCAVLAALFPIFCLSILETEEFYLPFSLTILRSIATSAIAWLMFWGGSVVLFGIIATLFKAAYFSSMSEFGRPLLATAMVVCATIYFRFLGTLAWRIFDRDEERMQ